MDRVRAEPELKEKTKVFVRAALADDAAGMAPGREPEAGRPARKRFRLAVSLAAACLMLTVGGYACYVTPVNYVCVDINPSVEFSVNLFGRVVRAQAYNEDGARLLEEGGYTHASVEEAVCALVEEAAAEGYLADDGSSVIAVTAESRSGKTALKLQSAGEAGAALALRSAEQSAVVYADCSDLQLRTQAQEAGRKY
ncbi:MAG TPA: hypothetical protein PK597_02505, partial [Oscillospiraceae bacterium]|nr:hypothetical protein [Oscillospiraceae bacterium]